MQEEPTENQNQAPEQINPQVEIPQEPQPEKRQSSLLRSVLSILQFGATVAVLVVIILGFGLQSYHVIGTSMTPTLEENDRLLISKLGRTLSRIKRDVYIPERGEIIVFNSPSEDGLQLVKRVIALPGERVVLENGEFTVFNEQNPDGFNPDNQYDPESEFSYTAGTVDVVVPDEEVFVTGDNRSPGGSLDSRNSLGTVPYENIVGKLIIRVLPVSEARSF